MVKCVLATHTNWMLSMAAALLLPACNTGGYNRSLTGQINALQQEVARLQEENRVLVLKLEEIQKRYGIQTDQITPGKNFQHNVFDKVFSN